MRRAISLLVLSTGIVFSAAQAGVIVGTSLDLSQLQIVPTFGVVQLLSPFSASAYVTGQGGTCPNSGQVNDGLISLSCASALSNAAGSASSFLDLTSLLAASAASGVNISDSAYASSAGQGGLGGDSGGTGLFEIYDSSNPTPSDVNVTFTATLSGSQLLATDAYGQSATSEIIFNLFSPDVPALGLFLDSPLSIGPNSSLVVPYSGSPSQSMTLQTNTQYTLIAEVDAESSGLNLTPEPSSFFLTALGLFAALFAGWRINRNRASGLC